MSPARAIAASHRLLVLFVSLVLVAGIFAAGCRKKSNPVGPPDGPQPGQWSIYLRAPLVMYRNVPGGHVVNDTIVVRIFNADGQLPGPLDNEIICSQASVSYDSVTRQAVAWGDTTTHWWGCNPALIYWGTGGVDGHESVQSWVVVNGDTVATASASFKVEDPH